MFLSNRGFYVPAPVLEAGAGVVGAVLLIGVIAAVVFRRWAKRVQDETGEDLPGLLDQRRPHRRRDRGGVPRDGLAPVLGGAGAQGVQLPGRDGAQARVPGPVARALLLHGVLHRGDRACRHPRGQPRPDRGVARPGAAAEPHPAARDHPAGDAHHRPATRQPVPEPHQELLARHRHRLHGRGRHHRRHLADADRQGGGDDDHRARGLPRVLADHLGVHELVQPQHRSRSDSVPSGRPRTKTPRRCRSS